jgi:exodeoxyribonuclease VII large subunit
LYLYPKIYLVQTYSLYELNEFLRRVIALNFNEAIWVTAEIGQINCVRGHYYLDMVQKEDKEIVAQMQGVIWAADYRRIEKILGDNTEGVLAQGMEIRLKGRLDFHERYGVKILIEDIDATFTIGKVEIQRQQLIKDLKKKGLIGLNSALPLPSVIQRIAVISSETAAGWQDFKNHITLNDYGYSFDIQLFQSAMQGSLVEKMLLQQLENIKTHKRDFDAVVIIRGGGARMDLVAFDTPSLCEAVARFPLPVLTGIGHDIDQTVIDMVAHTSLKTPTAVADFILTHAARFEGELLEIQSFIKYYAKNRLNTEGGYLIRTQEFIHFKTQSQIQSQHYLLDHIENQLGKDVKKIVHIERLQINNLSKIVDLMGIEATLKRGFSITKVNGKVVKKVDDVKKGDVLETVLSDGLIDSTV